MANKLINFVSFLMVALFIVAIYILWNDENRIWKIVAGVSIILACIHFAIRDEVEGEEND